jgi:hypothetical protein
MPRYPPQGGGITDLKTLFSQKIKASASDPADCINMETLVNAGLLTVDDVANYVNNIGTADFWAGIITAWSTSFSARVLNSNRISPSRVTSIFNSSNLPNSRAKDIATELATNTSYTNFQNIEAAFKGTQLLANDLQTILYGISFGSRIVDLLTQTPSDSTISTNTTLTGKNRFRNLTINSGITLTLDGQPSVIIAKSITNNGTITKTATGASGGTAPDGAGSGGSGGGELIILTDILNNYSTINANGNKGADGSTTTQSLGGNSGSSGNLIVIGTDTPGTGGNGAGTHGGSGNRNGGGGGACASEYVYGGAGGGSSTTTYTDAASLATDIEKSCIDWYIINVISKTPTTTKSFPNAYGSGGGGGAEYDGVGTGGGGGGGGGEIIALVNSLNNTGTISANGGSGGNGGTEGGSDSGGGGGGGGIVYVLYKSYTNLGTIQSNGGSGGTGDLNGSNGNAGTARAIAV